MNKLMKICLISRRGFKVYNKYHLNVQGALSTVSSLLLTQEKSKISCIENIDISKIIATSHYYDYESSFQPVNLIKRYNDLVKHISHQLKYLSRVFTYMFYGIPLAILGPMTITFGKYFPGVEELIWDYYLWSILQLGPTFIKLAQWVRYMTSFVTLMINSCY